MTNKYKVGDGVFYICLGGIPHVRYGEIEEIIEDKIISFKIKLSKDEHYHIGRTIEDLKAQLMIAFDKLILFSEEDMKGMYQEKLERKGNE